MPVGADYSPSTAHSDLGDAFHDAVEPAAFPEAIPRHFDEEAAAEIGLDGLTEPERIAHFARFEPLPGGLPEPLALRYHGHQFRSYNPRLGDGRGFLFAQMHDAAGRLMDLGTKGSGATPWSRGGDGRLTLKGGVRELLATKMLQLRGVETSRTFSLIETGEALARADEPSPARSCVLVRLSHGHIRIGTFQRLAHQGDEAGTLRLIDHLVRHYRPDCAREDEGDRATALLARICADVARMGARYMAAGFVHGVLNTDNINVTGESFDYGPWRFLPRLDPAFTAAYFDEAGLYAFGRQPDALLWNCTRLAECLLPFADAPALEAVLAAFEPTFRAEMARAVLDRLGLVPRGAKEDARTVDLVWSALARSQAPFERTLHDLAGSAERRAERMKRSPGSSAVLPPAIEALDAYETRVAFDPGPAPIDMPIERVEALWAPIAERDDWAPLYAALSEIDARRAALVRKAG